MGKIGILGGTGWLGRALGRNLLARGLAPRDLLVANRRGPTADYDDWPGVVWARTLDDLVSQCEVVVLSVRPEDYRLPAQQGFRGLVLSFMAGIALDRLRGDWPSARIARAMPGGGATEGRAHVPWCAAPGLDAADAARLAHLLAAIGTVDRVADEAQLAVLTALSGSGAAYPALMAQAMFRHACAQGIAADVAWRGVASVVCDAPELFRAGPEAVESLLSAYHGYRGVTAAGLDAADAAGFSEAIRRALAAAADKALHF